jgi:hypothetical protein
MFPARKKEKDNLSNHQNAGNDKQKAAEIQHLAFNPAGIDDSVRNAYAFHADFGKETQEEQA